VPEHALAVVAGGAAGIEHDPGARLVRSQWPP
jgi:hypothetical protein